MEIFVREFSTSHGDWAKIEVTIKGTLGYADGSEVPPVGSICKLVPVDRLQSLEHLAERCVLIRELVPEGHPLRGWIDDCLEKIDAD